MIPQWTKVPATRSLHVILLLGVLLCLSGFTNSGAGNVQQPGDIRPDSHSGAEGPDTTYRPYVPGELIVKLAGDTVTVDSINTLYGTTVKDYFDRLNIYILSTDVQADIEAIVESMKYLPGVVFAHPNYVVSPLQSVQGSYPFSDADLTGSYPEQDAALRLQLPTAHAIATGAGIKVGVIDGGVNFSHPELAGAVVSGWDFVDNDADAFDEPGGTNSGHGTFIAGVIHLTAPDAQIIAYRVADTSGRSNGDMVADAILRALDDGCRVINLSLVMASEHEVLRNALAYARSQDVMVVVAAGNELLSLPTYPASDPNVVAVAAVDSLDRLAEFSRYGTHVDLCAPGEWVYSSYEDIYAWWSGTSFAAPFVAGQAALKLSQYGGILDWRSLHASLIATAENINAQNPDYFGKLGAGLIDPVQSLTDTVAIDTAGVNPDHFIVSLPPDQTTERCIDLYASNPYAVFSASVLGGLITFTTISADSVLGPGSTLCATISSVGLAEGYYADTILFDVSGVSNSPLIVPIQLHVSDTSVVSHDASVWPASISNWVPEGWTQTLDACTFVASTNAPAAFTVHLMDTTSPSFIEILNPTGTTNDSVCIYLHPVGLTPGAYCDTLLYRVDGVPYDVAQEVCLTVGSDEDTAAVTPAEYYFTSELGGPPQTGCAYLTSTNAPAPYTAGSFSGWLTVIDSVGTTNDSVCFTVDPSGMTVPGTRADTIALMVENVTNYPRIIVYLTVTDTSTTNATATASPNSFDFTYAAWGGGPAQAGTFVLASTNAPATFTAEVALGSTWLNVVDSIGTTDDSVRFTVDGAGLSPGFYHDSIVCRVTGVEIPATVMVSLTVVDDSSGIDPTAAANPDHFYFVIEPQGGGPIQTGEFHLTSTNAPANFYIDSYIQPPWMTVHDSAGVTNDTVHFTVDATGLSVGTHADSLLCFVDGITYPTLVPVILQVQESDTLAIDSASVTPSFVTFETAPGGPPQSGCAYLFSGNAPASYTLEVSNGSAWLSLVDSVGMTNDTICVTVDPSAVPLPGTSYGSILCHVDGVANTPEILVALTISDSSGGDWASASPNTFDFTYAPWQGGPIQGGTFTLTSSNAPASYYAEPAFGSLWLNVVDSVGITNDSLRFTVDGAGLAPGNYHDSIVCYVDSIPYPATVRVNLTVLEDTLSTDSAGAVPVSFSFTAQEYTEIMQSGCFLLWSSNAPTSFIADARHDSPWLELLDSAGVTDDSVCFTISAGLLSAGYYIDTIDCMIDGIADSVSVPIELTVTSDSTSPGTAWATPPDTTVVALYGNNTPLYRSFLLNSSNAPAAYTARVADGPWLALVDSAGITNDTVDFVIDPSALPSEGNYTDSIYCAVSGVPDTVVFAVFLSLITWDSSVTASVSPSVLQYSAAYGSSDSVTMCVFVTSSNAPSYFEARHAEANNTFTALVNPWGYTNDSLCVAINPSGLSTGVHVDTIAVSVSGYIPMLYFTVELEITAAKVSDVQNYPNPFNPATQISFTLGSAEHVNVTVYNMLGQEVAKLLDDNLASGRHVVPWRGRDDLGREVASGIYFYRISTEGGVVSRKMLLLK